MAKGSRAYRRVPKKSSVNADYLRTKKVLNQVNMRLEKLASQGYSGTWSSKKLLDRLTSGKIYGSVSVQKKGGKITGLKLGKRVNKTEMVAIQKAANQFLVSQTSSAKGIRDVRERTIESLRGTLSVEGKEMTNEEAEFLYNMLGDNDFDDFVQKVGASTMWNLIEDARDANDTESQFIARLERMAITLEDIDLREKAKRIYDKYVI